VFIVILLLLFGGQPSKIREANMFQSENEAYAVAGLLSIMPEQESSPDVVQGCECDKKTGLLSTDGTVKIKCPCADDGNPCGCINCDTGQPAVQKPEPEPETEWYVTKITASWCGPCKTWNSNERHKLTNAGIKVKDEASGGKYKVSSIPRLWIRQKVGEIDSKENGETDDLILNKYGYSKGQDLLGVIEKIRNAKPPETKVAEEVGGYPFYVRQTTRKWSLNGNVYSSKRALINHFRTHPEHVELRDWPLEDLSEEELQWMHWDGHNNKLGKLQWK